MNNPNEFDELYFPGMENRAIRYYYYLNQGLNIINQSRNLFLAIFGLYFVLKLDNWMLLAAMFVGAMIILTFIGYYTTHKINRVMEWLGMRFATHYGIKQFNLQQGIYETLQRIDDKL